MRIQTNVESLNAYRNLSETNRQQSTHMERLSSGFRINRAADDAAGLAISEQMRGQIGGLDQATENAQDATSLIQTAEGALDESHEILQRMRELTVQAANDTNTPDDIENIQDEINQLQTELTDIAERTEFNTQELLDGSFEDGEDGDDLVFQIGANEDQHIEVNIEDMSADALADDVDGVGDIDHVDDVDLHQFDNGNWDGDGESLQDYTDDAIQVLDAAIGEVSSERSELGAVQNRLEHTVSNLEVASENLQAAESRIRETDMAEEMTELTTTQVLEEAGTAMLAQANQAPQNVLQLLG